MTITKAAQPEKIEELMKLSKPLVNYLNEMGHPYTSIVITQTSVKLTEDKMGGYFKALD